MISATISRKFGERTNTPKESTYRITLGWHFHPPVRECRPYHHTSWTYVIVTHEGHLRMIGVPTYGNEYRDQGTVIRDLIPVVLRFTPSSSECGFFFIPWSSKHIRFTICTYPYLRLPRTWFLFPCVKIFSYLTNYIYVSYIIWSN